jgi:hypothetical protein
MVDYPESLVTVTERAAAPWLAAQFVVERTMTSML